MDPSNYDYYNESSVAPAAGGSGITDVFVSARWDFKINGLYQLPGGLNLTAVFSAREGYVVPYYINFSRPGIGSSKFFEPGKKQGDDRLPTFWMLNMGLEKTFQVSDRTSFTVYVDGYNITNNATHMSVNGRLGSAATGSVGRVLNPGLFQFGVRVNF
jgi:hypothetical protein